MLRSSFSALCRMVRSSPPAGNERSARPRRHARAPAKARPGAREPAGGEPAISADVRLIASTSESLIGLVNQGRFREDRYSRLNVFPIWVPPLRERLEDLPELVRHFIARFAAEEGKPVDGIDAEAMAM